MAGRDDLQRVVQETLQSVQGTAHHLGLVTLAVLNERLVEALVPVLSAQRESVVAEVVEALQERGGELSELAEEKMSRAFEERAQEWYEAAGVAEKLKQRKPEVGN